jgi:FKBP-type peptidyl-prolyl cis-trans isomerase
MEFQKRGKETERGGDFFVSHKIYLLLQEKYMKYLGIILAIGLFFISCSKEVVDQDMVDQEVITKYITSKGLTMTKDPSGVHYNISIPGTGNHPSPTATVEVKYKGTLLDGTVFDQTAAGKSATFPLNNLIPGWRIAIPLLKKGGKGTFLIPSNLGYGPFGSNSIPGKSVLLFEIELLAFSN